MISPSTIVSGIRGRMATLVTRGRSSAWLTSTTLTNPLPISIYKNVLFGTAVAAYVYSKGYTWLVGKRNGWRVEKVTAESPNVYTVKLTPPEGVKVFSYLPGQFQFLKLQFYMFSVFF